MTARAVRSPWQGQVGRDVVPAADSLSLASPKESKQRKGDPDAAPLGVPRGAFRCSQAGGLSRKLGLEYKTSDRCVKVAAIPLRPQLAALLGAAYGKLVTARCASSRGARSSTLARACTSPFRRCAASRRVWPVCGAEERSVLGSEPYPATSAHLSEPLYPGASLRRCPRSRAPQGTPRTRGALHPGRLSLLTFFGEAKKVRRPPGRNPGPPTLREALSLRTEST